VDRLFSAHVFTDFGPCGLSPARVAPPLAHACGPRLRRQVRAECPRGPGVYGMLSRHGELIYVGKAKCLRTRLLSYFRPRSRDRKAGHIAGQSSAIAWEIHPSEFAALHRELELIRRWRPRLNVQGQPHGRRYTYLCLGRQPAAYAFLTRQPPRDAVAIFGPIRAGRTAHEAIRWLNDFYKLRDCSQAQAMIFAEQGELFPMLRSAGCLRYEIGTCLGPCAGACSRRSYAAQVRAARTFLEGENARPLVELAHELTTAAQAQAYERAAALRDRLNALRWLHEQLDQVRRLRADGSFIYPLVGQDGTCLWYLIHHGRTVAAVAAPDHGAPRANAAAQIEAIYGGAGRLRLESAEHLEGMLLVAAWFRRYPQERTRLWRPEEALARCAAAAT
jgi:excinuclease ABC subunit C